MSTFPPQMRARSAAGSRIGRRRLAAATALVALSLGAAACGSSAGSSTPSASHHGTSASATAAARTKKKLATSATSQPTTTTAPASTTSAPPTTAPASTTSAPPTTAAAPTATSAVAVGPTTSPPLPAPAPGFLPGRVTAVGDSVMIDYQGDLEQDVPGIAVTAAVSRGWTAGETVLRQLKASGQLGAVVVVGLATNGPVNATQFRSMMTLLSGASRVVFVNTRVDRTWQTSNNAVLAAGVSGSRRAVLADWYSLAVANPSWLYSTQTHLPIDGTGAAALAALVAGKV